jgi:8-amino-7-oxononanoate synthase
MTSDVGPGGTLPRIVRGPASARINLNGREYINFAGSGYLALGRELEVRGAAVQAIEEGCAFSRQLPSAYGVADPIISDLEAVAAAYCGTETAVYFASGYFIGAAALNSMDLSRCALFIDETAHFSLVEAARTAGPALISFAHCDPDALSDAIRRGLPPQMRPVVVTDGVSGTTGRVAPLDRYAAIVGNYDGCLVVDEAHSFGVIGPNGRGAADLLGVERISVTAATLSKAFCGHGGLIGCDRQTSQKLRGLPPLRGANAGSPISAAVGAAALRYMMACPDRRTRLDDLTRYLRTRLRAHGIDVSDSPAPIVAFQLGDRKAMQSLQRRLFDRGIHIMISDYVGAGPEGIIRCAVFADHSEADLDALITSIE